MERRTKTREHVIGRNFVPAGATRGSWNLVLNACQSCNTKKSDLEDEISALTMQPDPTGAYPDDAPEFRIDAERKAQRSFSRQTGKPVAKSSVRHELKGSLGPGMTMSFSTVGPPQLDNARVHELARHHALAFFYLLTYDGNSRSGRWPPGVFMPVSTERKSDWGNPVQRDFARMTADWPFRMGLSTASGYFKALIRRNMPDDVWSFALEWNRALRCVGFFGDEAAARELHAKLPELKLVEVHRDAKSVTRWRSESQLPDSEDTLFDF